MDVAREVHENGDKMSGDSVCSTMSGCSLLKCHHFHDQSEIHPQQSDERPGAEDSSNVDKVDLDNASIAKRGEKNEEDNATFRSVVMRQFKADIDRLLYTVAQKVENSHVTGGSGVCGAYQSNQPNVYSVVKSGCLGLLLNRVLPPLQEQFEKRLIDSLQTAGLLQPSPVSSLRQQRSNTSEVSEVLNSRHLGLAPPRPQPPQPHPLPMPAPRLHNKAETWLFPPLGLRNRPAGSAISGSMNSQYSGSTPYQLQRQCPHPPPRPAPRLLTSAETETTRASTLHPPANPSLPPASLLPPKPSAVQKFHQRHGHNRIHSPYFVHQKMHASTPARTASSTVRNNSSLKPPSPTAPQKGPLLHRSRQLPPPQQPAFSCSDLVRTFLIRDSPTLRTILFDPDDRKIKSFSQRYGCYISLYEMNKRAGHLLHKVVVRAPNEKALRMCISALDSGLNWDLASQLKRNDKKSASSLSK